MRSSADAEKGKIVTVSNYSRGGVSLRVLEQVSNPAWGWKREPFLLGVDAGEESHLRKRKGRSFRLQAGGNHHRSPVFMDKVHKSNVNISLSYQR